MKIEEFRKKFKGGQYLLFLKENGSVERIQGFEKHHIYPRSFESGEIQEYNTVWLSVEDHIRAHLLLVQDFEKYAPEDRDFSKALKAINITCNTRWETLTEVEKDAIYRDVPQIAEIRQKAMQVFLQEKLKNQRKQGISPNWGCITEKAREKAKKTVQERYGRTAGYFFTPEALEHNRKVRLERYGSVAGMMHSPAAREKAKNTLQKHYGVTSNFSRTDVREKARDTMKQRYGGNTAVMNCAEVKIKNRKIHEERYGSMTALMNTPEARRKAVETQKKNRENRWKVVKNSLEFQIWYKNQTKNYKSPVFAINDFLKEQNRSLQEFVASL